ncbi:hypothetical protein HanRHA438_Chr15g0713091 [Helianthus annuus]|nr:hypothetical protein HanRHA438_Chr15g0713091 [Helianthus annuus]
MTNYSYILVVKNHILIYSSFFINVILLLIKMYDFIVAFIIYQLCPLWNTTNLKTNAHDVDKLEHDL